VLTNPLSLPAPTEALTDPLSLPIADDPLSPRLSSHPILVSNVAASASQQSLREFFEYCGPVGRIKLSVVDDSGTQQAVVNFGSIAAQETALLLEAALIVDRPISICKIASEEPACGAPDARPSAPAAAAAAPASADALNHDGSAFFMDADTSSADGSEGSARYASLHGLLGAGYRLGQRALSFLSDFEQEHGIKRRAVETLSEVSSKISTKVKEIDESLQVSAKLKSFDDEHEVSVRASAAWSTAKEKSSAAVEAATPVVASAAASFKAGAKVASEKAGATAETVKVRAGELGEKASASFSAAKQLVQEDERVQQGWAKASAGLAGVGAWASSAFSAAKKKFAEATPPPPPPPPTTSVSR